MRCNSPLVSVIIPCFKEGDYLLEAVESIEQQTYSNWEIVIGNDCSPDERTNELCRQFENEKRAKVVFLETHKWTAGARNAAIQNSNGEVIFTLDGDDKIAPDFLQKTVPVLLSNKKTGFVYTDMYNLIDGELVLYKKPEFNVAKVIAQGYPGAAIVYKHEDYNRTTGYCEDLKGQEDWEFLIQLCGLGLIGVHVPEPLYFYRRKGEAASKHIYTMRNFGLESKFIIINKNRRVFRTYDIDIIKHLYSIHNQMWLKQHNYSSTSTHIKWLIASILGKRLTRVLLKLKSLLTIHTS